MGLFSKKETRSENDNPTSPNDTGEEVLLSSLLRGDEITAEKALSIPAVSSAVNRVASMVAVLPIKLYKREDDGNGRSKTIEVKGDKDDKRQFLLNIDSGDVLTQYAFKRNLAKDFLLEKGGFAYIKTDRRGGKPQELRYVPPKDITAVINDVNPLDKDGRYMVLGKQYEQFDFIAVLRDTDDGFLGKPLTKQLDDVLSTAVANILYEMGIVKKGGTKKGFLQADKTLSKEAMAQLKKAWRELYSNTSENVIVLNSGLKFQEASDNAVDLQVDQRKKSLRDEINEVFGIHSDNFDDIFRDAILPVLEAIESALNKNFLTEDEKADHYWSFDKREILKAQLKERYEAYKIASEIGVMTKNEIRDAENLSHIDGLDIMSMNLSDVLFDTKSKEFFTPNTGKTKTFDQDKKTDEETVEEEAK